MSFSAKCRQEFPRAVRSVVAALCLASGTLAVADGFASEAVLLGSDSHRIVHQGPLRAQEGGEFHPGTPMMLDPGFAGVPFNVDVRDSHRLELRLAEPLSLRAGSQAATDHDAGLLGLDASLRVPLGAGLSLAGGVDQAIAEERFLSLGSIHCHNGILRPDSYTASGCRFVNEATSGFDRRTLSMGPQFDFGNVAASLRWFTSDAAYEPGMAPLFAPWRTTSLTDPVLAPAAAGLALGRAGAGLSHLDIETSGVDLDFQVGFTTDQAGDIRLGLALTRIYGADYEGFQGLSASPLQWSLAAPFNTAALDIEWSRGAFSGGVRGYYQEPIGFLDHSTLDSVGTFDVHFTWRTPWNANLSVGASNVLNSGVEDAASRDEPADRFESIYGRIPYVRYQQDL